jgi:altronate hydrolase
MHLHPLDNVAIAKSHIPPGTTLLRRTAGSRSLPITVQQPIPPAHKIALQETPRDQPVRRYGQVIGIALSDIHPGDHVHTHNLGLGPVSTKPPTATAHPAVSQAQEAACLSFLGYRRADGQVATRNYIAVISTVSCSAHATLQIAHHFTPGLLSAFPNVDGVIALTFRSGCTMRVGGETYTTLQRTLAGMVRHPNVGACLLVGLGCETNQAAALIRNHNLERGPAGAPIVLSIQELGGLGPTVQAGIAAVAGLLPHVNATVRTPQPISHLRVALQCGGSDGWSGVTANPIVGLVADKLVRQGGTVVLAETPEIYGAEHLLTSRAIGSEVSRELGNQVRWWEEYAKRLGTDIDNNPSPGNKAGGLTTIYEKALGAVAKSGSSHLVAVYDYAEPVLESGLTFMNTPGFDPVSVTGQVAGGCNLILFTTGRGSAFGFKPAPCIKVASNTALFRQMPGDMDFDAGRLMSGAGMDLLATELLDTLIAVASGQPSKSEAQGIGEAEFSPWHLGETL